MSDKIQMHHLQRRAVLYIRQSSAFQVAHNVESQKLQYAMEARLRQLGWQDIEIIDEDLGRSAAGSVERSGFERMVAQVWLGQVGAVAAREVSRFARNSREWQQLVEMCRVVDTLLIDQETVYSPRLSNDVSVRPTPLPHKPSGRPNPDDGLGAQGIDSTGVDGTDGVVAAALFAACQRSGNSSARCSAGVRGRRVSTSWRYAQGSMPSR